MNETHDPGAHLLGRLGPGHDRLSRFRIFRSASSAERDDDVRIAARRRRDRRPDPRRHARATTRAAAPVSAERAAEACAAPSLNPLMGLGREPLSALRAADQRRCSPPILRRTGQGAGWATGSWCRWRGRAAAAGARSATTPTSTRRSTTRPTSAACSGPTIRCSPTTSGCRSAITAGPRRSWSAARPCGGPRGQIKDAATPTRRPSRPSRALDYEMELGCFVGAGNALGEPVPIEQAEEHLFGLCLVNDWSARDIQTLGVPAARPVPGQEFRDHDLALGRDLRGARAVSGARVRAAGRRSGAAALSRLATRNASAAGSMSRSRCICSASRMRETACAPRAAEPRAALADLYWTPAQMLDPSHQQRLQPLARATCSRAARSRARRRMSRGCLLELTWRGTEPITLPTGETRKFLEDGDEVIMRGYCEREGAARIGFGECRGVVRHRPRGEPAAPIRTQVSAGGVAFRATELTGGKSRWCWSVRRRSRAGQLPTGPVRAGRDTRVRARSGKCATEAGVEIELVALAGASGVLVRRHRAVGSERGLAISKFRGDFFVVLRSRFGAAGRGGSRPRDVRARPAGRLMARRPPGLLAFASERRVHGAGRKAPGGDVVRLPPRPPERHIPAQLSRSPSRDHVPQDRPRSPSTAPTRCRASTSPRRRSWRRRWSRSSSQRWICVGREDRIANPGDYFLQEIGKESVIVLRDRAGGYRAYYNVCRHRGTRLCEEHTGRFSETIQCPYHAWTYAPRRPAHRRALHQRHRGLRQGRLAAAPGGRRDLGRVPLHQPGGASPSRSRRPSSRCSAGSPASTCPT